MLDACAAPGGKAFHLAELLAPGSEVVAVELHPRKADELAREAARRGLAGVRVVCADAARPIPGLEPARSTRCSSTRRAPASARCAATRS